MSAALVVANANAPFSKAVTQAVRQAARSLHFAIVEVGDELDLPYGAQKAIAAGARVVVCIGAVVGAEAPPLLGSLATSLTRVGLDAGVPVLSAVSSFSNDLVARRADARAIADSITNRISKLGAEVRSAAPPAAHSAPPPPAATAAAARSPPASSYGRPAAGGGAGGGYHARPATSPSYGGRAGAGAGGAPTEPAAYRGPSRTTADAGRMGVQGTLASLREQLKKHGAKGIFGLGRKFRIMDDDGSKSVNMGEFKKALRETGVIVSDAQVTDLFKYFDNDGTGSLSYDEFLVGVRGELNPRRKGLVGQAFGCVDKDGNGVLDLSDIIAAYDASKHPEVLAGKKTKNEIFREFLDNFDGGEKDGKVWPEEFERYYANISASIDDDDYFELMIRNAWHISGGEGWSANTTCRRVLVTRWDGTKEVVEIKNDLGVGNDLPSIKAALRRQGEDFQSVQLHGSTDTTEPPKSSAPAHGRFAGSPPKRSVFESSITF